MSNIVIGLVSGGGITALAVVVAAYYYGVRTGRALESDAKAAKVAGRTQKINEVLNREVTADEMVKDAQQGKF